MEAEKPWLSVKEAAEQLGADQSTVYRLCRERKIQHRRIGTGKGRIVFKPEDLAGYLDSCLVPIGHPEPTTETQPVVLEFFEPQIAKRASSRPRP